MGSPVAPLLLAAALLWLAGSSPSLAGEGWLGSFATYLVTRRGLSGP